MIKNDKLRQKICRPFAEELNEMDKEEQDIYLFLRGGFTAK